MTNIGEWEELRAEIVTAAARWAGAYEEPEIRAAEKAKVLGARSASYSPLYDTTMKAIIEAAVRRELERLERDQKR
jgi:hypothetical protein